MASDSNRFDSSGRRRFLKQVSAAMAGLAASTRIAASPAVAGEPAPVPPDDRPAGTLPTIALGKYRVSRMVAGSNPINGYSYMGPHADRHMREYFTVERTVEFLQQCEREGINTFQFSTGGNTQETLAELRRAGSQMQLICLHASADTLLETVKQTEPIAMVHHGGVTDKLFAQGQSGKVHDFVKRAHDAGVLAGVSAHNPDCIRRIADEGWEVDFFMTCLYFLTRASVPETQPAVAALPTLDIGYPFFKNDPQVMTEVVRQVPQPCLAFKILAAGRMCNSEDQVRKAFAFAFEHIKPIDGVIVGMYPRFFDEIHANAEYTRQYAVAAS